MNVYDCDGERNHQLRRPRVSYSTKRGKVRNLLFVATLFAVFCALAFALAPQGTFGQRSGRAGRFAGRGVPVNRPFRPGSGRYSQRYGYGYGWPLIGWAAAFPSAYCYAWEECDESAYSYSEPQESVAGPILVLYLRDGSGYGVTDYWLADGMLRFVTTYGAEKSIQLDQLDVQRTVDENAANGLYFTLSPSPTKPIPKRTFIAPGPSCDSTAADEGNTSGVEPNNDRASETLGIAGSASGAGLRVAEVQPGSIAAKAGIAPGDVVVKINCQPVRSSQDIDAAVRANQSGIVWVSYLIKGTWLREEQFQIR